MELDSWSKDGSNVECQGIGLKKVFELMQKMVLQVAEFLDIPSEYARSLLILHKWNKERTIDACLNTDQYELYQKAGIVIPGLDTCFLDSDGGPRDCKICFCEYEEDEMATAGCGHYFCKNCWLNYLRTRIMDESEGEDLHCMAEKCLQRVSAGVISKICGIDEIKIFSKHQELCAMKFIQTTKFLRRCPAADCHFVVQINESEPLHCSVTCPCGNRFCFQCYEYAHDPVTCARLKLWKEFREDVLEGKVKAEEENKQSEQWLRSNSKKCPQCSSPIEKNGGCNHMTCKQCTYEFCWVCMGVWQGHGNANSCNAYVAPVSAAVPTSDEQAKRLLERFRFHKTRYDNHMTSMELEKKYRAMIRDKFVEFQNLDIRVTPGEATLLKNALYVLLRSRLLLAHSYVFAFYVKDCAQWELYLANQGILETSTEELTAYFQDEFLEETIEAIKSRLPVLINLCSLRIEAMLDHISEGYEKGIWKFND